MNKDVQRACRGVVRWQVRGLFQLSSLVFVLHQQLLRSFTSACMFSFLQQWRQRSCRIVIGNITHASSWPLRPPGMHATSSLTKTFLSCLMTVLDRRSVQHGPHRRCIFADNRQYNRPTSRKSGTVRWRNVRSKTVISKMLSLNCATCS